MVRNAIIALLIALAFVLFIKGATQTGFVLRVAEAPSAIPIDSCTTITESGYYVLSTSIFSDSYDPCIIIQADNVTLDCNSYSITGPRPPTGGLKLVCSEPSSGLFGIISLDSHSNITVKNCYVSNDYCRYGIYLNNVENSKIINNVLNSTMAGIGVYYSTNNNITNNILSNNDWAGFDIENSINNYIANNIADGNDEGIYLYYSDNNTFINNTATDSISDDIDISYSVDNIFINQYLTNLSTPINFTYDGDIILSGVAAPASDPAGYKSIGIYISTFGVLAEKPAEKVIGEKSVSQIQPLQKDVISGGDVISIGGGKELIRSTWLALNISYSDTDLSSVDESTLRIAKYNDSGWFTNPFVYANNFGLDTRNKIIYANITDISGGVFVPLGLSIPQTVNYISSCSKITSPGIYKLNQSISGTLPDQNVCINILADDVTLDCDGYSITGPGHGGISTSNFNVVIKNCYISNYEFGILLTGLTNYNKIINNTLNSNRFSGIFCSYYEPFRESSTTGPFYYTTNNLIANNTIINTYDNDGYGIIIGFTNNTNVINNTIVNNIHGIWAGGDIYGGNYNNTFVGNIVSNSTMWDICASSTINTKFINQYITNLTTPISFILNIEPRNTLKLGSSICLKGGAAELPSDPRDFTNISKYINITTDLIGYSWLALNISYSNADLPYALYEPSLRITKYNESEGWITNTSLFASNFGVDTRNKIIYANITNFEELNGIFAPLGKGPIKECTNITEPGKYTLIASLLDTQPGYDKCIDIQTNDVVLDCAGSSITGSHSYITYGIYSNGYSNITIKNCTVTKYIHGIFLTNSRDSTIVNNTLNENDDDGIYLESSSNCTITDNNVSGNYCIRVGSSSNNTISNNLIDTCGNEGIWLGYSTNNILVNNNISNAGQYGMYLYFSDSNNLTNNILNHNLRNIEFYSSNNNIIIGNALNDSYSSDGIGIDASTNNVFINNIINNSAASGIHIQHPSSGVQQPDNNTFVHNIIVNSGEHGIYLDGSSHNTFVNNVIINNSYNGIYLESYIPSKGDTYFANNNTFINNIISNNSGDGVCLEGAGNNTFVNNTILNNANSDLNITASIDNIFINQHITNFVTPVSFTYYGDIAIKSVRELPPSPRGHRTIGKYIDVTVMQVSGLAPTSPEQPAPAPIKTKQLEPQQTESNAWLALNISYSLEDVTGLIESNLRIAKYNGTDWILDPSEFSSNYGVDTVNKIVYANITTAGSVFAPLGNNSIYTCTNITSRGTYPLTTSLSGNQSYGPCIDIQADNVELDCAGYSITGDLSLGTHGIFSSSHSNITIKNCNIANYTSGIYFDSVTNSKLVNNSLSNSSASGIYLKSSNNTIITNNSAVNSRDGIFLVYSSANNTIENNYVENNYDGISLGSSSNNTIINNIATNNNNGIHLFASQGEAPTSYNVIENNIVNNNKNHGIYLDASSNNNLINNTANNNTLNGIFLGSDNNILLNNTLNDNGNGIAIVGAKNNTLLNNEMSNNTNSGVFFSFYVIHRPHFEDEYIFSTNNNLTSNIVSNNTYGFYFNSFSNNNTLVNNTALNNTEWDIYIKSSTSNLFDKQFLSTPLAPYDFTGSGDIGIKGVTNPPSDPAGFRNINKYLEIANLSEGAWFYLTIPYSDSDLPAGIDESSLRIAKYDGSKWLTDPSQFSNNYGVDTVNNIVYANITGFGSVFAALGTPVPQEEKPSGGITETLPRQGRTITIDISTEGTTQDLATNDRVIFTYDGQLNSGQVLSLGFNSVLIEFTPSIVRLTLNIGDTKEVDLNKDGIPDILVRLEKIEYGRAYLTFKTIEAVQPTPQQNITAPQENITAPEENITVPQEIPIPTEEQKADNTWLIIAITLIALAIAIVIHYYRKKKNITKQKKKL